MFQEWEIHERRSIAGERMVNAIILLEWKPGLEIGQSGSGYVELVCSDADKNGVINKKVA